MNNELYKANRSDNGEIVVGYYFKSEKTSTQREMHIILTGSISFKCTLDESNMYEIDPKSLRLNTNMLDDIIIDMFNDNWSGKSTLNCVENMRKQLYKNLKDQINGYWSGSSAYSIMIYGGFLVNSKRGTKKELTMLGKMFINDFEKDKVNEQ